MAIEAVSFNRISGYYATRGLTPPVKKQENIASLDARNVAYHVPNGLNLNMNYMQADMIDLTPHDPLDVGKAESYKLKINKGEVSLSDVDISVAMSQAFADDPDSPIKKMRILFMPQNRMIIEGTMQKSFLKIPFQIQGKIDGAGDNFLNLVTDKIKVWNIPVKSAMDLLGLKLGTFIKLSDPGGKFFISGNNVFFSPTKFTDAPAIIGNVNGARTDAGHLAIVFGESRDKGPRPATLPTPPPPSPMNYLNLKGGNVEFEGTLIKDPDVTLLDKTPNTPLDFLNAKERIELVNKGEVTIPEKTLKDMVIGGDIGLNSPNMTVQPGKSVVTGKLWIFPLKFSLVFGKTPDGQLTVTPKDGKVLGFIPIPSSMLRSNIQKTMPGSQTYGDSVILDLMKMNNIGLGPLKEVVNAPNGLVLKI